MDVLVWLESMEQEQELLFIVDLFMTSKPT
jgi:hypothetical protein